MRIPFPGIVASAVCMAAMLSLARALAAEIQDPSKPASSVRYARSEQYGRERLVFEVAGHKGFIILPGKSASQKPIPWVWYAPTFLGGLPGERQAWICSRLLEKGLAICGVEVGESFGSLEGRAVFTKFYQFVVGNFGLTPKACLWAQSRGGLMHYNWAADHPELVSCIGGTYPICRLGTYAGYEILAKTYRISMEELRKREQEFNPLERLAPIAAHKVPMLSIHGDQDRVVPLETNTAELASRYKALGGDIEVMVAKGKGHEEVAEFFESPQMVDFFVRNAGSNEGCSIKMEGNRLVFSNDHFRWQLDLSSGVWAEAVENRLTGERFNLGRGPECGLRFSGAERRIELLEWKQAAGGPAEESPEGELGLAKGFHQLDFDDREWQDTDSPWLLYGGPGGVPSVPNPKGYNWFRVKFNLPAANGKPATFGLGGCGVYDFGKQKVFLNGKLIGERIVEKQVWKDATLITLKPGDPGYGALRFGGLNVLAVQAWSKFDCRPLRARQLDPGAHYGVARLLQLQDQFAAVGPAYEDVVGVGVGEVKTISASAAEGRVQIVLNTAPALGDLTLNYQWSSDEAALRKWLEFKNTAGRELLLLDVELGDYKINVPCTEGFRGYPIYLNDSVFMSIAHPCGVAQGSEGRARLRHFPGRLLKPGETFTSKQAVFGIGKAAGGGRQAFWDYLLRRSMRRAVEGIQSTLHYDGLAAAWGRPSPWGEVDPVSEKIVLEIMDKMMDFKNKFGLQFDYFWLDAGWWDFEKRSELIQFNSGFPGGPGKVIQRAKDLGMRFGIWTSRGSMDCTASEETQKVYRTALEHHLKKNGIEGLKFDGQQARCFKREHWERGLHLPGKYSTEAFQDANLRLYSYAREMCPNLWIFGYWGHDSPWWLISLDTTDGHGLDMENRTACAFPTIYSREATFMAIDQASQFRNDMPPRGRDTLGVWVTDSQGWASFEHSMWLDEVAIDICRGHGMLHLWADLRKFTDEEGQRLSRLAKILKANPDCFANSKLIIGDPWKDEPYGYTCSNGERAFVVVHNPTFEDRKIEIQLEDRIGLTAPGDLILYRHSPVPARMAVRQPLRQGGTLSWHVRPSEVVLYELAPASKGSTLALDWNDELLQVHPFAVPSRQLDLRSAEENGLVRVEGELDACPVPCTLVLAGQTASSIDGKIGKKSIGRGLGNNADVIQSLDDAGKKKKSKDYFTGSASVIRIPLEASQVQREVDLSIAGPQSLNLKAYLIPVSLTEVR